MELLMILGTYVLGIGITSYICGRYFKHSDLYDAFGPLLIIFWPLFFIVAPVGFLFIKFIQLIEFIIEMGETHKHRKTEKLRKMKSIQNQINNRAFYD